MRRVLLVVLGLPSALLALTAVMFLVLYVTLPFASAPTRTQRCRC